MVPMMLMDEYGPVVVKRRGLCHPCLLHREERRAFHTIFKELAVENKHAQFVDLFEQIAPFVTKQGSQ